MASKIVRDILTFAESVLDPNFKWKNYRGLKISRTASGVDVCLTVQTALGLLAKVVKLYRGIILLSDNGLPHEAGSLCRTLFESMVAVRYLLCHELRFPKKTDGPVNTDLRTSLFILSEFIQREKALRRLATRIPGEETTYQPLFTDAQKSTDKIAKELDVDSEWLGRLRGGSTYSTLSLEDLCERLGMLDMYAIYYPYASLGSHAADIFTNHAAVDAIWRLHLRLDSSNHDALHGAGTLILMCVKLLHDRLGVVLPGVNVGKRLDELLQELQQDIGS